MKHKGRKTISKDGEKMRNRNFRATDAEWEKCLQLGGGAFLRAKIKAAKVGHNVELTRLRIAQSGGAKRNES